MVEKIGLEAVLDMADFNRGMSAYMSGTTQMNSQTNIFAQALGGLNPIMATAASALGNILANAFSAVVSAIQNAGTAIINFGVDSARVAADFQGQMAILSVAASGAGLSIDMLHDAALAVGSDTDLLGVSATGAADAMTGLYKAGLTTTEIFGDLQGYLAGTADLGGALRASIDLAAASELDMVQASELAAIVLATFGSELKTEEERANFITTALNTMVKAADASVAEVSDLAAALSTVGPSASAMGLTVDEVNTALAILSTRGITGAEAGTALKSMFTNMQRPTNAVKEALNKLSVKLFDAQGNMKDFRTIIADFQAGLVGLTEEERNLAIQTIAGTYGMNAMNTLISEGVDGWDAMSIAMGGAAGIQEQAQARAATFAGRMEALNGVIETLKIGIGESLLPVATKLADWFSEVITLHGPQITGIFEMVGTALSGLFDAFMVGGLPGLLDFLGIDSGVQEIIFGIIDSIMELIDSFQSGLPVAIQMVSDIWSNTLFPAMQAVWSFIQNSVLPVFETIGGWFQELLPVAIQVAVDYFNLYLLPVFASLAEQWTTKLQPALASLWTWLQENIPVAIKALSDIWTNTLQPVVAAFGSLVADTIIPIVSDLVAWFIENLPVAITALSGFWENILYPAIQLVFNFISETLIPKFQELVLWLQENIPGAIETARAFWEETLHPALEAIWAYISENIIPIFSDVVAWLQETIPIAIQTLTDFWNLTLLPALQAVWDFISEYLIPLFTALSDLFSVVLTLAIQGWAIIWTDVLKPALEAVWSFVSENLMPVFQSLATFLAETLGPALNNAKTNSIDPLVGAFDAVKSAIQWVTDKVNALVEALSKLAVPDAFNPGSPPPFYYALMDIGKAMNELSSTSLPKLGIEMTRNLNAQVSPAMMQSPMQSITNNTRQVNAPITATINNGMDMMTFQTRIQQAIANSI